MAAATCRLLLRLPLFRLIFCSAASGFVSTSVVDEAGLGTLYILCDQDLGGGDLVIATSLRVFGQPLLHNPRPPLEQQ